MDVVGDLKEVAGIINEGMRFLLTCHMKPDGDALGAMLGLGLVLEAAGREVRYYAQDPIPKGLGFLPGSAGIEDRFQADYVVSAILVILDCNEPSRIGDEGERLLELAERVVVLDHHVGDNLHCRHRRRNERGKCYGYIDVGACSTAVIVMDLLQHLNWPLTKESATCLYTGLFTDTGSFRHSNTDKKAFLSAARLLDAGVDNYYVANKICQNCPKERLELLGLVLKTLEIHEHGLFAMIHVTPKMFDITGATEDDINDFICYPRSIDTVELAAFVKEVRPGHVSVSLRSKNFVNCVEIAKKFGGGGHVRASGFSIAGSVPEVRESLLKAVHDYFKAKDLSARMLHV